MHASSSWTKLVRGTVVVRRTSRLLTCLILVIAALAAWEIFVISTSTFARRLPAEGEIISQRSGIQIVAPQSGILVGAVPESGEVVHRDQHLFVIQSAETSTAGYDELDESSRRKRDEALAALNEIPVLRDSSIESHKASIRTMEREAAILRSSMESQHTSVSVMAERVQTLEASGDLFSPREVETARLEWLGEQERLSRSQSELLRIDQRIRDAEARHQQHLAELQERERNLRVQLVDLESNEQQRLRTAESSVLAPATGAVSAVLVAAGQAVRQGQVLAVVDDEANSADAHYSVRLKVSTSSIGAIEKGSEVWVEVKSFPAREFGLFLGKVSSIAHINPQQSDSESSFIVEAELQPKVIRQFGKTVSLRNGMAVKADVVTDRLTLLEWILEPVLVTLGKQASL